MASWLAELAIAGCSMAALGNSKRLDVNWELMVGVTVVFNSSDFVEIKVSEYDPQ